MSISRWWSRVRPQQSTTDEHESAADALAFLPPEAQDVLASLHGAPPTVCQAVVQLLPLGSRIALEQNGLARQRDVPGDHYRLVLTSKAFEVMEVAAACAEGYDLETDIEDDELDQRARAALVARSATRDPRT
ncbi:hypothetical protein PHK61_12790 [Actinomycetospora lutea]|uniref:hypothetical protein n=1 Tax=Actinomycetospora lutea TaxID=663604 RepID=UPI0023667448|nr:hypothetical protein [Actinomycetospora lutea]MDD7939293.1 hypothetical protein [Actinomycetospora lutea]